MRNGNQHCQQPVQLSCEKNSIKNCVARATCAAERSSAKYHCQKRVRFAGTVKVCVKQVTQEDLCLTWYGPTEYKSFQKDSKRSLKAVSSNLSGQIDAYDSTKHCLRGLEACVSSSVYQSRKDEKSAIVTRVLQHQFLQRIVGANNQESLATLSKGLSKSAQERALVLAAIDSAKDHNGETMAF